jgi:RNA polymerase sigma-70 factor (ECF subfamily)
VQVKSKKFFACVRFPFFFTTYYTDNLAQSRKRRAKVSAISFDAMYDELFPRIYRYVYLRIPRGEVEDVAAEIMAKIWRNIASFTGRGSLGGWSLKLAARHVADFYRQHRHIRPIPLGDNPVQLPTPDVGEQVAEAALVHQVLASLPEKQVSAIQLRLVEGLSSEETAAVLGISIQAVDSLLYRAKQNFREIYRRETGGN